MSLTLERPRTLKAWKALHVVGARLDTIEHWQPRCRGKVRTIVKVQGNAYAYTQPDDFKEDGVTLRRYWSDFPRRPELSFHDDGSFTVRPDAAHLQAKNCHWRLRFIE